MFVSRAVREYADNSLPTVALLVCVVGMATLVSRHDLQGFSVSLSALALSMVCYLALLRQRSVTKTYLAHLPVEKIGAIMTLQGMVFALVCGIGLTSIALSGMIGSLGLAITSALVGSKTILFWTSILHASCEEAEDTSFAHAR